MIRIKNNLPARLPSEYQEVEYIEGTGSQYIDTGLKMASGYSIEAEIGINSTKIAFGASNNYNSTNNLGIEINSGFLWTRDTKYAFTSLISRGKYELKVDFSDTVRYQVSSIDISLNASYYNLNYYLFSCNENNVSSWNGGGIIWSFKIKNGNELIRNYVPCYRKSDNVVGLYDLVNNVFYTNAGSGTFLMGNEVYKRDLNINPAIFNLPMARGYINGKLFYGKPPSNYEQLINYKMLYDNGNECTDITGGWNGTSYFTNAVFEKNTDHLHVHSYRASAHTVNRIDTSNYDRLFANTITRGTTNSANSQYFLTTNTIQYKTGWSHSGNTWQVYYNVNPSSASKFLLDTVISAKGNYYVSFFIDDSNDNAYINLYNMALIKNDDWQTLANLAGITASSIDDILTKSATLLSKKSAVEFMIKQCTGSFMVSAIQSETFLTALNNSAYNTTIQANEHWNKFLAMVAYSFGEPVEIEFTRYPHPTSWTVVTTGKEYTATNEYGEWRIWADNYGGSSYTLNYAFDNEGSKRWESAAHSDGTTPIYMGIDLPEGIAINPKKIYIKFAEIGANSKLLGFNQKTKVWESVLELPETRTAYTKTFEIETESFYTAFKFELYRYSSSSASNSIYEVEFTTGTIKM